MAHLRNGEFGRYTTLKEIPGIDNTDSSNNKPIVQKPTRTMKISEPLYRRFVGFSKRYYDVETYETILENLINCYEEHNQDSRWRDIES